MLKDKIIKKEATIGIVGLGYVGLPLVIRYVKCGYKVVGFDIDKNKVDQLNSGESYIEHIKSDDIKYCNEHDFVAKNRVFRNL